MATKKPFPVPTLPSKLDDLTQVQDIFTKFQKVVDDFNREVNNAFTTEDDNSMSFHGVTTFEQNILQSSGKYISTDEVRARSSSGLILSDDGGNSSILVNDGGILTFSKQSSSGACRITSSQSIAATTWTPVVFNSELFDVNSEYNVSNGRFTATKAGKYFVSGGILFSDAVNNYNYYTAVTLNNGSYLPAHLFLCNGKTYIQGIAVGVLNVAANDYIEIQVYTDYTGGVNVYYGAETYFYVHKVA